MPEKTTQRILVCLFLLLAFLAALGRVGSDTDYDETNYCGISRSLWESGQARTDDGCPGGALFKDSPVAVPFLLAPASGLLKSIQAVRIAHFFLFVLPGLLVLAVILSRAGTTGMAAGFFLFLVNPYNLYGSAHVNLDQGLSSWGLIALYCFVARKHLGVGLLAMLIATLCKYQAAVVGLTLLGYTIFHREAWKRLLLYGAVSACAMLGWLALVSSQDPAFLSAGFGRFVGAYPWSRFVGSEPARLLPFALVAVVGVWRNRRDVLIQTLAAYMVLTLAFNVAAVRLPGGMGYYLTPALLPLAACGGYAFAGVAFRRVLAFAPACLCVALAKDFVAVPLPLAGVMGLALAAAGAALCLWRPAWGLVSLAGPLVVLLPHAEPVCVVGVPDAAVRTLLARAGTRAAGTWDDPRVPYWAHHPLKQAKWVGREGVGYFILGAEQDNRLKAEQPVVWADFHDYLARNYELDATAGTYSGWREITLRPDRSLLPQSHFPPSRVRFTPFLD